MTEPHSVFDLLPHKAVLVIGDVMLDRFVYGSVNRISPEAPVPVLSIEREDMMLGGAGNVLSNLAGLEIGRYIISVIGDDDAGKTVQKLTRERGADETHLIVQQDRPTTVKTRYLAQHQQLLRTDYERVGAVSKASEDEILRHAEILIPKINAVILSDYGKGVLTPRVIFGVIALAKKLGIPVLVDPRGSDYSRYRGADVVTPNRKELAEATGNMPTATDSDIESTVKALIESSGVHAVVATRSKDGMSVIKRDGKNFSKPLHLRTAPLEVFDVSGAGDTVIATLATAMACGASLEEAAELANKAGQIVVTKVGTAPIRRDELHAAVSDMALAPLCSFDEAAEQVRRWKARGWTVGLTNGCFDLLHYGHVSYLAKAREQCDRLIVGLNSDASVKRLKGAERPVQNQDSRAAVLSALGAVDMVVLFGDDKSEDDKPIKMIEAIKPDLFFKGGDYSEATLPEAATVKKNGGRVVIMQLHEGHSTTAAIKKIRGV